MNNSSLRETVYAALFSALIIVGGYLRLPLGTIPLVLADFFVILAGMTLGGAWGGASVGMFIFLGMVGLPVFAGGAPGPAVLMGPTGGFIFGYLGGAILSGFVANHGESSRWKDGLAIILGFTLLFTLGVGWMILMLKLSPQQAVTAGLLPFLPGTVIKGMVIWFCMPPLRALLGKR